jgi:sRNA-binding carbon storage regulator CsrA
MLTLTRRIGEAIRVGSNLMIRIEAIDHPQVRIRIDYPPLFTGSIFTFHAGQTVPITTDVTITIHRVGHARVHLGVIAPPNMLILRQEIAGKPAKHPRA